VKNLISKKTAALSDGEGTYYFSKEDVDNFPTIIAFGDLGSDTIPIMYLGSDGTTLTQAYDDDGVALILSETKPAIPIKTSMQIKAVKGVTTNAVGVDIAGVY
jgi:hypothetical protein